MLTLLSVTGYSNPPAVRDMILRLRGSWSRFAEFIGLPPETVDKLNDIGHQQTHDHEIVHVFMKLFPIPNVEDIDCILLEAFDCAGEYDTFSVLCHVYCMYHNLLSEYPPHLFTPPPPIVFSPKDLAS